VSQPPDAATVKVASPATTAVARPRFAALHSRNFRVLWLGLIFSNAGTQMQNVAQAWLVLQMTNSALSLGFLSLSFAIPMILLPIVGGAVADRVDRITLLKYTQTAGVVLPMVLAAAVASGHLQVWMLYAASLLNATVLAFDNPARQALLPGLVPREDLMNATSLNSAAFTGAALFGPALGGLLLQPLGAPTLFVLNGLSTLVVLAALFSLRDVRNRNEGRVESLFDRLTGGLRFAWRHQTVLAMLALSACVSILGRSYQTLLPVFARDLWHAGASGYGLLLAAPGAGALLGAFGTAALGDIKSKGRFALIANAAFCVALALFSLVPPYAAGLALLLVSGLANTAFGAAIATMLQLHAPGALRGRIMSLYTITIIGMSSFGGLLAGAVAQAIGAPGAVRLGTAVLVVMTLLLARLVMSPMAERGR